MLLGFGRDGDPRESVEFVDNVGSMFVCLVQPIKQQRQEPLGLIMPLLTLQGRYSRQDFLNQFARRFAGENSLRQRLGIYRPASKEAFAKAA